MIRTLVPEFDTFWASNSVNSVEALADIGLPGATYLIITNAGLSIKLVKLHSPADVSTVWSSDASSLKHLMFMSCRVIAALGGFVVGQHGISSWPASTTTTTRGRQWRCRRDVKKSCLSSS